MKSQQCDIYHVNKMTSLCDMCTKTIDVNFGATILTLTFGEWRLDCGLESRVGRRQYMLYCILHLLSASSW